MTVPSELAGLGFEEVAVAAAAAGRLKRAPGDRMELLSRAGLPAEGGALEVARDEEGVILQGGAAVGSLPTGVYSFKAGEGREVAWLSTRPWWLRFQVRECWAMDDRRVTCSFQLSVRVARPATFCQAVVRGAHTLTRKARTDALAPVGEERIQGLIQGMTGDDIEADRVKFLAVAGAALEAALEPMGLAIDETQLESLVVFTPRIRGASDPPTPSAPSVSVAASLPPAAPAPLEPEAAPPPARVSPVVTPMVSQPAPVAPQAMVPQAGQVLRRESVAAFSASQVTSTTGGVTTTTTTQAAAAATTTSVVPAQQAAAGVRRERVQISYSFSGSTPDELRQAVRNQMAQLGDMLNAGQISQSVYDQQIAFLQQTHDQIK